MKRISSHICCLYLLLIAGHCLQAQKINVSLEINGGKEAAVYQNEAVLIDIAVFNKKAQADQRWNMAGEERMIELNELLQQGKIKQEEYDREKTSIEKNRREVKGIELGSASSSWTSVISWKVMNMANRNYVDLPIKLLKKPSTDGKAVLDANGYYVACFGISPDDMKSVSGGRYAIECFINSIQSGIIVLNAEKGMVDMTKAGSENILLRTGQYYWHADDGNKTVEYADRILSKNPVSLDGLSLKGDGLFLQKSYQAALESYKKATAEYYKQNGAGAEPPEYLISMIDIVKKQMGQ